MGRVDDYWWSIDLTEDQAENTCFPSPKKLALTASVTFLSQCQQIVKVDVSSELELCLVAVRGWQECADCAI